MDAFDFGSYAVPTYDPGVPAPHAPSVQPQGPAQDTAMTTGGSVKLLPPSTPPQAPAPRTGVYAPPVPRPGHHPAPSAGHHRLHRGRRATHGVGDDTVPATSSNLLGLALITVPVAAVFGARYAGLLGALGGALLGGAAVNTLRAFSNITAGAPETDKEATVSGTFAALGALGGGYLLYKGHKEPSSYKANESASDDDDGYDIGKFRI